MYRKFAMLQDNYFPVIAILPVYINLLHSFEALVEFYSFYTIKRFNFIKYFRKKNIDYYNISILKRSN